MSGHHGSPPAATTTATYSGLQIQSTSSCLPIPIAYGANMFSPNCIWYNNFQKHPQNGKGHGKGGGSSSAKNQTTYSYSCSIVLALCEGPINGIGTILNGSPPGIPLSSLGTELWLGETPQAAASFIETTYPSQALGYNGVAYLGASYFNLGMSASVGSYTFEVFGVLYATGVNGHDADPALVIQDFLTNAQYGVGFPSASLDTTSLLGFGADTYQSWCWANYLAFSPVLNSQEKASSILERWLKITHATAVWTSGLLKIIPYGDSVVTGGNGTVNTTWTPNLTPLYDLTDEDFVGSEGDDPVKVLRSDPYSAYNWQSIEVVSRGDYYNTGPVSAWDQSAIDRFGLRVGSSVTAHEICDVQVAQASVQLILQRDLYIRNTYKFKLSWEFCLLDPMDLVTLTDPLLGLNKTVVRITDVEEDEAGLLSITAEEFPQGVATGVQYPTQTTSNTIPNNQVAPNAVNAPVIIEPPPALSGGSVQVWLGLSGASADPNWGGAVVWASLDGTTFLEVATLEGASTMGVTTAALATFGGTNPDTTDTLSVSLVESGQSLSSTTSANAASGYSALYVGGEYIAFTTATLTGVNTYNLTGLYRGLFGIAPQAIPSGAQVLLLSGSVLKYDLPTADVGDTIYFKFQSFNIFGAGVEDISTCSVYSYGVTGLGVLDPVAQALGIGTAMDYGNLETPVSESDDFGPASSLPSMIIDLGNVTS